MLYKKNCAKTDDVMNTKHQNALDTRLPEEFTERLENAPDMFFSSHLHDENVFIFSVDRITKFSTK